MISVWGTKRSSLNNGFKIIDFTQWKGWLINKDNLDILVLCSIMNPLLPIAGVDEFYRTSKKTDYLVMVNGCLIVERTPVEKVRFQDIELEFVDSW